MYLRGEKYDVCRYLCSDTTLPRSGFVRFSLHLVKPILARCLTSIGIPAMYVRSMLTNESAE